MTASSSASPNTTTTANGTSAPMKESKKAAFETPNRDSVAQAAAEEAKSSSGEFPTVTPPTPNAKQVRFDKENADVSSKRGLVSRRGGRYGSPSRSTPPTTTAVEYKTYRSPKREEASHSDGGVPSLCSSNCDNLREAPSMISCSEGETTSPLTEESPSKIPKNDVRNVTFSPRPNEGTQYEKVSDPMCVKLSSLYLSISNFAVEQTSKKTPTRSPLRHQFHNLPSLRDAKLSSPCGIFLSPCPPSPSAYATIAGPLRVEYDEEKSTKSKSEERERAVATPTDFAVDFGKGHQSSASFDASNGELYCHFVEFANLRMQYGGRQLTILHVYSLGLASITVLEWLVFARWRVGFRLEHTASSSNSSHTDAHLVFLFRRGIAPTQWRICVSQE